MGGLSVSRRRGVPGDGSEGFGAGTPPAGRLDGGDGDTDTAARDGPGAGLKGTDPLGTDILGTGERLINIDRNVG